MPMSDEKMSQATAVGRCLDAIQSSAAARDAHLLGLGAVGDLERRLAAHYGMRHALCVCNATTGLMLLGLALDLRGVEFLTTPYTYGGSLSSWLFLGNSPLFADIEPLSLTLDGDSARKRITPETKAVLGVDIYGHPSDTKALRRLADDFGLWYVADAAQSLGAYREGRPASSLADALVVSFTVGKSLYAGEGGAILTDNDALYEKLLWYGQHPMRQKRELGLHLYNEFGLNARMHPLAAVWANASLEDSLAQVRDQRNQCFQIISALNEIGLTEPILFEALGIEPSFFRLTAAWKGENHPDALMDALRRRDHDVQIGPAPVTLIYLQSAFRAQYVNVRVKSCPEAEHQAEDRFCLFAPAVSDGSNCARSSTPTAGLLTGM